MDATPTNRRQNRGELTPLLRTPSVMESFEFEMSPSLMNLHSRIATLHDGDESVSISTPQNKNASPILKRARFESPNNSEDIGSDFLSQRLREANNKGERFKPRPPSRQPPRQSTPPSSSSDVPNSLDGVLIAKQQEINSLKDQLKAVEKQLTDKTEESRRQVEEERKYNQERVNDLELKTRSLDQDLQASRKRSDAEISKLKAEIQTLKSRLAESDNRIIDLTEERDQEISLNAKTQDKLELAHTRAARLETRANELDAALKNARTSVSIAEDKANRAVFLSDEAQSMKNGLLQQISNLENKLETIQEDHTKELDDKQSEINHWRIKLNENEKLLKSAKDTIQLFKAAEEKITQENEDLHKLVADEKVQLTRADEKVRLAKGEIAELQDQIRNNTVVVELRRQLESQQKDLDRASGILGERDQRIKKLEHELSDAGRSAEFTSMTSKLLEREQHVQTLGKKISELESRIRQDYLTHASDKNELDNLRQEINTRDQTIIDIQRALSEMQVQADTTAKQARSIKAEYDKIDQNYKRVYTEYLGEIESIRSQASMEVAKVEQAKMEAATKHSRELEEAHRQKDQAILAQQRELEQRFTDLSSRSGNSLAEALREQREQLERDYTQHLERVDRSTEERIQQIKELAELQVKEYERDLEAKYNVYTGKLSQLEDTCSRLQYKLDTTLKACQLVLEYQSAYEARTKFVMDDLVFIKGIATSCLEQIEEDDRRRLAALGLIPARKRTLAGAATFALGLVRLHKLNRPQIPPKLEYDFRRFTETSRID